MKARRQNSLAPVLINGTRIKPKDVVHRRKLQALQVYVKNLLASSARPDIAKIILFGSVAKGEARPESDIDVMVLGFDNLDALQDASYDATLELGDFAGEGIEPLFETIDEWFKPEDYFMYRVTRFGKEVYSVPEEIMKQEEAASWLELARDYLSYTEYCFAGEKWRAVADLGYNAAELCVKGLLLLKMDELPSSHGGLLSKFGEYYTRSGPFPRELGRRLSRGLQVRSWARYRRQVNITREMAEENLNLAKEMINHLDNALREQK
jgi:uncharacterized protein (UPF0332 family)/predicted nucleotidyltransferase